MRLLERALVQSRDAVNSRRCIHSIRDFSERNSALYVSTYLGPILYCSHWPGHVTTNDAVSCVLSRLLFKATHGDEAYV